MSPTDGWQVLHELKADVATRDIPVVVLSIVDDKEWGYRLGALDYLVKPFRVDDLETLILKAQQQAILAIKSEAAPEEVETFGDVPYIVGNSPAIEVEISRMINRIDYSESIRQTYLRKEDLLWLFLQHL